MRRTFRWPEAAANRIIGTKPGRPLIGFALAFPESIAFFSLLIPVWAALVGIGALIGASDMILAGRGGGLDWGRT